MRAVSPEEARTSLNRLKKWAKEHPKPQGGSLGEWVFKEQRINNIASNDYQYKSQNLTYGIKYGWDGIMPTGFDEPKEKEPLRTLSLTQNAIQLDWKHPVRFPCCPQQFSGNPLEEYMANLKEGVIFSTNDYGDSNVMRFGMPQPDCLWVMCSISIGWKSHAITKITFDDGIFYHANMGVYDPGDDPEEIFDSILKGENPLR